MLHTRISEQLAEDIRSLADDMRIPVSNLVRNVLEEVFTAVETVSSDVGEFFEDVLDEADGVRERIRNQREGSRFRPWHRRRSEASENFEQEFRADESAESGPRSEESRKGKAEPPNPAAEEVLGWQAIVLNRALDCADCGKRMEKGDRVQMGISAAGRAGRAICESCLSAN